MSVDNVTGEDMLKALKEMNNKTPLELDKNSMKLFNAIMKIADERDMLKNKIKEMEEK